MTELEITFGRAARVWWAYTWRAFLIMLAVGVVFGIILTLTHNQGTLSQPGNRLVTQLLALVIAIPIGIWMLKKALCARFREFRIALIQREPSA